jgi:predicted methyltransferase
MCELKDFDNLELDEEHRAYLETELEMWHKYYLPIGKIVLDIGAGNGETAQFYLNHGAEHVVCIEPNSVLLKKNFATNSKITIIPLAVDSIKCDCEGGEENIIIETHRPAKFKKIFSLYDRSFIKEVRVKLALGKKVRLWRLFNE